MCMCVARCLSCRLWVYALPNSFYSLTVSMATVFESMRASLATARVELLDLLSSVLLGDRTAAEYLLLHLLSYV